MFCPANAYVSLLFVFIASLISASSVPVGKLSMIVTEKVNHEEGVRLKSDNLIDKGPLNELSM